MIPVTLAFGTADEAHLFVGQVTHTFNVACMRRGLRIMLEIPEDKFDALVAFARKLGGEALVV